MSISLKLRARYAGLFVSAILVGCGPTTEEGVDTSPPEAGAPTEPAPMPTEGLGGESTAPEPMITPAEPVVTPSEPVITPTEPTPPESNLPAVEPPKTEAEEPKAEEPKAEEPKA